MAINDQGTATVSISDGSAATVTPLRPAPPVVGAVLGHGDAAAFQAALHKTTVLDELDGEAAQKHRDGLWYRTMGPGPVDAEHMASVGIWRVVWAP